MIRPTVAVSGITEAKRREQGRIGESNIIAAHPDKWWLRELILSQLANAEFRALPSDGWTWTSPSVRRNKHVVTCKFGT
jgi:hypothetical protein